MAAMDCVDDVEGEEALRELELEEVQAQAGHVPLEPVPRLGTVVADGTGPPPLPPAALPAEPLPPPAAVPAEAPLPAAEAVPVADPRQEASAYMAKLIEAMGAEDAAAKHSVYLGTLSRVLPETLQAQDLRDVSQLSREQVAVFVRDAWDNPMVENGRGRRRQAEEGHELSVVVKLVVFREKHVLGEVHFHVALKLSRSLRFAPAKLALRMRHKIASHWSCSHTQFFSAVRYGHIPSVTKPEVDQEPYVWTADGSILDLYAESQEPFMASRWKRRREENEKAVAAGVKKPRAFSKIDLTALILDNDLETKAAVLAYAQDFGTATMQAWVHQHQRKIKDFLDDAREWAAARAAAEAERETDWDLLCRVADGACPHGEACAYERCATDVFQHNHSVLCKDELAFALRKIIKQGPSKTTRTPLIVGPTNTGKTTLVLPFDMLFGKRHVFHKPALGSKFALRNINKEKRFLLWDDFRPVQYAKDTVPTATLLSLFTGHPFEVQVSQSFNDGNMDFEWRRGAVVTAKEKGLWDPSSDVTEEDVSHIKSRFMVFRCAAKLPNMQDVDPCACHMARWIRDAAAAADARTVLQPVLPTASPSTTIGMAAKLDGMDVLSFETRLPSSVASALQAELLELGAVDVRELPAAEWETLKAWALLKPLQQRRVLRWLQ